MKQTCGECTDNPLMPPPPGAAAFDRDLDGWVLSRYADVLAALREPALWKVPGRREGTVNKPDTAAQQAVRAQVVEAFSSQRLNAWRARIERVVNVSVFDGPLDLVSEFIEPWCLAVAEIVTGSNSADGPRLLAAARIVSAAAADPADEDLRFRARAANAELERYFEGAAIPMAAPTFVALSRTLACLLANGWLALLRHPVEFAQLRARPEQIPKAVEEILRYACLPQSVFRAALSPTTLCGLNIAQGDRVILRVASANRDPLQFPNPDHIDFARRGSSQLSLGFGPHSCVGASLIRMTAATATRAFLEKFGDGELCGTVVWHGGEGFRSPATLFVRKRF